MQEQGALNIDRMGLRHTQRILDAIFKDHPRSLSALLESEDWAIKLIDGATPLMIAASHGKTECVKLLIEHSDPREVDERGWNALHFAAGYGRGKSGIAECVALIAPRVDVEARTSESATAMTLASMGDPSIVHALAKRPVSANLDHQDSQGDTPLMCAIKSSRFDCAHELLQAGARADIQNNMGETALMLAAQVSDGFARDLVALSDVSLADRRGKTALDYASDEKGSAFELIRAKLIAQAEQSAMSAEIGEKTATIAARSRRL